MRIVREPAALAAAFRAAQAEAAAAFGVPDVYVERYVEAPRHVEIQVIADTKGNVVHLGERECSIQRRHQKLLEESPSPVMTEKLRRRMGRTAVEAAAAVQYVNAGTLEFLLDAEGNYYFMEMNTRIQVEHGVTELVTGRDLVKEQIRIAAGQPLSFAQKDVVMAGHAIECRINAEDPVSFTPSPGVVRHFHVPGGPGVRVDTAAHEGAEISPFYDSLIAKLMAHGRDRGEAIARMRRCLELMVVEGIKTTIPLHRRIMDDADFQAGRLDTRFMERYQAPKRPAVAS
jgi:acetyl-CoA carboxylase biotin carboxylase subunit